MFSALGIGLHIAINFRTEVSHFHAELDKLSRSKRLFFQAGCKFLLELLLLSLFLGKDFILRRLWLLRGRCRHSDFSRMAGSVRGNRRRCR